MGGAFGKVWYRAGSSDGRYRRSRGEMDVVYSMELKDIVVAKPRQNLESVHPLIEKISK